MILPKKILIISHLFIVSTTLLAGPISSWTLDNGLKLIVKEDHRSPIFIMQTWYDVGASNETLGMTGISHLLEHMMFKGTKQVPAGEFSRIIARNGGRDNAFTAKDYTAYYQTMNKDKLAVAIKLEADRMQNLRLKSEDLETERQVVIEERRLRIEDSPTAKTYEKLRKMTYEASAAYHYPIIGLQQDIEKITLAQLKTWYQIYYVPNNAVIVIVGDVKPQMVYALVKANFASIPKRKLNKNIRPAQAILSQKSSLTLRAQLPLVVLNYSVPTVATQEKKAYALEVLSYLLNGNDNAILNKRLKRDEQLVSSVSVYYNLYDKYQTNFTISFTPIDPDNIAKIKTIILGEIKQLQHKMVDKKLLFNIYAQAAASYIYEQDSIRKQAYYLGALETIGLGYELASRYDAQIATIVQKDIQKVIKQYLQSNLLSEIELIPKR